MTIIVFMGRIIYEYSKEYCLGVQAFFSIFSPVCENISFFLSLHKTMPRGKRISLQLREIIARLYLQDALTPQEIYALLYRSNRRLCSFKYLTKLCSLLRNPTFRASYLIGGQKSPGRPLSQSYFNRLLIRQSVLFNKSRHVSDMYRDYCLMFYPDVNVQNADEGGNGDDHPHMLSLSTFKRTLQRGQITRKRSKEEISIKTPLKVSNFLILLSTLIQFT